MRSRVEQHGMKRTQQGLEEESIRKMKEEETPKIIETLISLIVEIKCYNVDNEKIVRDQVEVNTTLLQSLSKLQR